MTPLSRGAGQNRDSMTKSLAICLRQNPKTAGMLTQRRQKGRPSFLKKQPILWPRHYPKKGKARQGKARQGKARQGKARQGKQFFFEKKNQKTFGRLSRFFPESPRQRFQKSFASFLQKRRPFLPRGQIGP